MGILENIRKMKEMKLNAAANPSKYSFTPGPAHSDAFNAFFSHLYATGMEFAYGAFDKGIFSKIRDDEREEIEDAIFEYVDSCGELVIFFPELKKYNGIAYLKDLLEDRRKKDCPLAHYDVLIARTLYEATGDESYLDLIIKCHEESGDHSILATLSYMKPCRKIYDYMIDMYIRLDDAAARFSAVDAMLCYKGYLKNPMDNAESQGLKDFMRIFMSDDPEQRKETAERFDRGELKPDED